MDFASQILSIIFGYIFHTIIRKPPKATVKICLALPLLIALSIYIIYECSANTPLELAPFVKFGCSANSLAWFFLALTYLAGFLSFWGIDVLLKNLDKFKPILYSKNFLPDLREMQLDINAREFWLAALFSIFVWRVCALVILPIILFNMIFNLGRVITNFKNKSTTLRDSLGVVAFVVVLYYLGTIIHFALQDHNKIKNEIDNHFKKIAQDLDNGKIDSDDSGKNIGNSRV